MHTVLGWISTYGYVAITSLLALGIVGLPIPDETLLVFSGYLVHKGDLKLLPTFFAAFLGSMCGITISYVLGRTFGLALIHRYGKLLHLTDEHIQKVHDWFARIGHWSLTVGYYMPGIRHFTAIVAGTSRLEPATFALYAYSGGLLWVSSFIALGYYLGESWSRASEQVHRYLVVVTAVLITGALIYYWLSKRKSNPPA